MPMNILSVQAGSQKISYEPPPTIPLNTLVNFTCGISGSTDPAEIQWKITPFGNTERGTEYSNVNTDGTYDVFSAKQYK